MSKRHEREKSAMEKSFEYKFIGPLQSSGTKQSLIRLKKRIKFKKNFNLSFEWKMKSLDEYGAVFLTEPSLLNFQFQKNLEKWKLRNDTGYFLAFDYDKTNWEPIPLHFGKWNKEF